MTIRICKKIASSLPAVAAALLLSGCSSLFSPAEEDYTPDLSLNELEKKMLAARDPKGLFLQARSYVQRQVVSARGQKYLVEVKYLAPDKFKIDTIVDNQPVTGIILNGDSAWLVNYPQRRVTPITGDRLIQLQTMYKLGNPDDSYQDLFAQVTLTLCRVGDEEFYKMTCQSKLPDQPPLILYVGKNSFLIRRIVIPAPTNYESTIDRYSLYEGVMIPEETVIDANGVKQTSKIDYNKLNAEIDDSEFLPPVFPPEK